MISFLKKDYFTNVLFLINLLILPSYLTGPFLTDLLISLSGLIFLVYSFLFKDFKYYNNIFTKLFICFYLYILVRSILSVNILLSLESSLFYFRFLFFSLSILFCLNTKHTFKNFFLYSLISTYTFLLFDAFYQLINGVDFFGIEKEVEYRISAVFGEELILGSFLSRTLPMLIAFLMFIEINYKVKNFLILLFIAVSAVAIFITGERAAFFNYLIFTSMFLLIVQGFRMIKLLMLSIGPIILIITIYIYPIFYERMFKYTIDQIGFNSENKYIVSEHHQPLYESAYKMFLDNIFFGHGPKLFRYLCKDEKYFQQNSCNTHPHNTYLQLLAETGILGFCFVFVIFLYSVYYFISCYIRNFFVYNEKINKSLYNERVILISLIIINLWPLVPTGSFFNNYLSILYFFPAGFLLYNFRVLKNE